MRSPQVQAALALASRAEETAQRARSSQTKTLAEQARRLTRALQSLEEMVQARSPTDTLEAHTLKVSQAAKRMQGTVEDARGHFTNARTSAMRDIYAAMEQRTGLTTVDGPRAQEIRSYFRSLSDGDRVAALKSAVDARDVQTLSAIFAAPAYLSGVPESVSVDFRRAYENAVVPDLLEELDLLRGVDDAAIEVSKVASSFLGQALNPGQVAEILQQQSRAEQVNEAFVNAVTGSAA